MNDKAKAMVLASFAADTLSLGAHWIYDTNEITRQFGRIENPVSPLPTSYHPKKQQGDFTHYGDQALALLNSLMEHGDFSPALFSREWQDLFLQDYQGYIDKATTATMANLADGKAPEQSGSSSTELGGAARIAPLVYLFKNDREKLLASVALQTSMTHNHPATLAGAQFIALSAYEILHGATPVDAMEAALDAGVADIDLDARIRMGLDSCGKDTTEVIQHFGQMCAIAAALTGAVHLVATYENNLREGLIANVMAGGDSAARGLVAGMLLGAHLGLEAVPPQWIEAMTAKQRILDFLQN